MLGAILGILALVPVAAILFAVFKFLRRRDFSPAVAGMVISLVTSLPIAGLLTGMLATQSFVGNENQPPLEINIDELASITVTTNGECSPIIHDDGNVTIACEAPKTISTTIPDCTELGALDGCIDKHAIVQHLRTASYAFNRIGQMSLGTPETIALVIDTSGSADFDQELDGLPGTVSTGVTPISLQMEAELVGPAFTIEPEGRQRREISTLNPTRWEWEVTPEREGEHPLEVSLYVVLTKEGEKISEDKPLAERQVINVTVSRLDSLISFAQKIDPLRAFIFALVAGLAGLLAWFGIKSWKDVSGKEPEENKPQKIEVTIKDGSKATQDKENN